jgi:hypothetical protein
MKYDPKNVVKNIGGLREANTSASSSEVTFLVDEELHGVVPEPIASSKNLPEWYKNMPLHYKDPHTNIEERQYTARGCRPLMQGFTSGWLLPLPADVRILRSNDVTKIEFGGSDDVLLQVGEKTGITDINTPPFDSGTVVKFHTPWYISVPNGYSVLEMPPLNRHDSEFNKFFSPFGGIWDADYHLGKMNPFALMEVKENVDTIIPAGTPIAQIIVINRDGIATDATIDKLNQAQKQKISKYKHLRERIFHLYADYLWNPIKASRIIPSSNNDSSNCPFSKE